MLYINKEVDQWRFEGYQEIKLDNVYLIFSLEYLISVDITIVCFMRFRCQKSVDLVFVFRDLKLGRDIVNGK